MKRVKLKEYCGQGTVKIAFGETVYVFTIGQMREVPEDLAKSLLRVQRPCGLGIFELVT